jgi:cobalamin-dependent methionine synthase I
MDDHGMPETVERRVEIAQTIAARAVDHGIEAARLYYDPLIRPLSSSPEQVEPVLKSFGAIPEAVEGASTICGLSNISFGLPKRRLINTAFMVLAIEAGLDAVICDPTESGLVGVALAAEALKGRDDFCLKYIAAERSGLLR